MNLLTAGRTGATSHLTNPRPLAVADVLDRLRARGYPLAAVSAQVWADTMTERAAAGDDPALSIAASHWQGRAGAAPPVVFVRDTLPVALRAGAEIDTDVIDTYVDHLVDTGFLPRVPVDVTGGRA